MIKATSVSTIFTQKKSNARAFLTGGYVPCIYNDKESEIIVAWDSENPDGYVAGARPVYSNTLISSKGLTPVKEGDVFSPRYDVYDKDMNYVETITLDDEKLTDRKCFVRC